MAPSPSRRRFGTVALSDLSPMRDHDCWLEAESEVRSRGNSRSLARAGREGLDSEALVVHDAALAPRRLDIETMLARSRGVHPAAMS